MNKGLIRGIILIAVGAFIIYWAIEHSPNAAIGKQVTNLLDQDSYIMSETTYYISLVGGSILALLGIRDLLKS